jgi:hypothetical protein
MANIEQVPGALDIKLVQGDDFTFTASFVGDITLYTHTAFISDGEKNIATFTVTDTFGTPNTVVSFNLTDAQTALLPLGTMSWYYVQVNGDDTRTILAGSVSVIKR